MIGKPGTKLKYAQCDRCGKYKPEANLYPLDDGRAMCLDCITTLPCEEPEESETCSCVHKDAFDDVRLKNRILEVLRLYAAGDSWGGSNQHRTANRWQGTQGAGFGPARRLLEEMDG